MSELARKDKQFEFVNLLHHVTCDLLYDAFPDLKKTAAFGVGDVTSDVYDQDLESNSFEIDGHFHRGDYRPDPSRRVKMPKPDGRKRQLGIDSREDKIV